MNTGRTQNGDEKAVLHPPHVTKSVTSLLTIARGLLPKARALVSRLLKTGSGSEIDGLRAKSQADTPEDADQPTTKPGPLGEFFGMLERITELDQTERKFVNLVLSELVTTPEISSVAEYQHFVGQMKDMRARIADPGDLPAIAMAYAVLLRVAEFDDMIAECAAARAVNQTPEIRHCEEM